MIRLIFLLGVTYFSQTVSCQNNYLELKLDSTINASSDETAFLIDCVKSLEKVFNSEEFKSRFLGKKIKYRKFRRKTKLSNAQVLTKLFEAKEVDFNGEDRANYKRITGKAEFRVKIGSTQCENQPSTVAHSLAGSPFIVLCKDWFHKRHESTSLHAKIWVTYVLAHEYMHMLGFMHGGRSHVSGSGVSDVPNEVGLLVREILIEEAGL